VSAESCRAPGAGSGSVRRGLFLSSGMTDARGDGIPLPAAGLNAPAASPGAC
jgi:hypothetical protein